MHPIERLRYVARIDGADFGLVAMESAAALGAVAASEVAALVPSCRRLIERHVTNGALWWLSARVLSSPDPVDAAREAAAALEADPTYRTLTREVPDDTAVLLVGWPDIVADAVARRGDLEVLVTESGGEGDSLVRRMLRDGSDATPVPDRGIGAAATVAGLVLLEALAAGPSGIIAAPGSHAAAAVARHAGVPVWATTGVGRVLPDPLWSSLLSRLDQGGLEPWDRDAELVPADLLDLVVGPDGLAEVADGLAAATCPPVPELLRPTA
jgi:hypothetical protein